MARPRLFTEILIAKSIRLANDTWVKIAKVAREQGTTSGAWIRNTILKELEP